MGDCIVRPVVLVNARMAWHSAAEPPMVDRWLGGIMLDNSVLYNSPAGYATMMAHYETMLARWPVAPMSHYVETRHGTTHVLSVGPDDAPALFIFHGWSGNASTTYQEYDLRQLTQQYRIFCPDTIGQSGRSAPNKPMTSGPAYGEWLSDVFDGLHVERARVMGISGGGFLALKIASYAPERVIKAVAMSTAGIVSMTPRLGFIKHALPVMVYPTPATARRFASAVCAPTTPAEQREAFAEGMHLLFKHYKVHRSGPQPLSDDELSRITVPVLILMGQYEQTCNVPKLLERARRLIPRVETELVPDAGHSMTIDQPRYLLTRIRGFMQDDS